jgi:hypothetical protein
VSLYEIAIDLLHLRYVYRIVTKDVFCAFDDLYPPGDINKTHERRGCSGPRGCKY